MIEEIIHSNLKSTHPKVESLRAAIKATFVNMDRAALQQACERFRHRLVAIIQAEGRYIKYILYEFTKNFLLKIYALFCFLQ